MGSMQQEKASQYCTSKKKEVPVDVAEKLGFMLLNVCDFVSKHGFAVDPRHDQPLKEKANIEGEDSLHRHKGLPCSRQYNTQASAEIPKSMVKRVHSLERVLSAKLSCEVGRRAQWHTVRTNESRRGYSYIGDDEETLTTTRDGARARHE